MTVITSTIIESGGMSLLDYPCWPRAGFSQQTEESKMRKFLKLGVPAAAFVVAATVGMMTASPAHAGEYCRTDVSGHMTGCGFSTLEQCQAAASGIGGDCFRDPSLPASASNGDNRNSFAYQPNANGSRVTHHARRRGEASSQ